MYFSKELDSRIPVRFLETTLELPNPHWHDNCEIIYVKMGRVCVFLENAESPLILEAGEMLFCEPNIFHSPAGMDDTPNIVDVFSFSDFICPQITNGFSFIRGNSTNRSASYVMSLPDQINESFSKMTEFLCEQNISDENADFLILCHAISFILSFFEKYGTPITGDSHCMVLSETNHRVRLACSYIESHPEEKLRVDELAKIANYSQSHFFRLFREVVGCSVHEYISRVKIREAQRLLRRGEGNVTDVSYRLGFSHPNNFSRTYKRLTGKNPRDERKTI